MVDLPFCLLFFEGLVVVVCLSEDGLALVNSKIVLALGQ